MDDGEDGLRQSSGAAGCTVHTCATPLMDIHDADSVYQAADDPAEVLWQELIESIV